MTEEEMKSLHDDLDLFYNSVNNEIRTNKPTKTFTLKVKESVRMPEITWYLTAMIWAYHKDHHGAILDDKAITRGMEPVQGQVENSHGCALNFQTRGLTQDEAQILVLDMRSTLGEDFVVVLKEDHIYCEYDLKKGK